MAVQTPPEIRRAPPDPSPEVEGGVIEDARARQQRHRRIAGWLLAAAIAAAGLIAALGGGGDGAGTGGHGVGRPAGGHGAGGGVAHLTGNPFPGAPSTQPNGDGVADDTCPLAPKSRYLPPRSGCVTVRRADIDGDGKRDLVLVYSRLSRRHPCCYAGEPTRLLHQYEATSAFLRVVLANGATMTRRISGNGAGGAIRAAAVDAIAHVNKEPGDEIFLEVSRISSGATGVVYSLHDGRIVPAGVTLEYGGDSGIQAGFDCLPGNPPRIVERTFGFIGPTLYGRWKQTDISYDWHGARLVQLGRRTFIHHGEPPRSEIIVGHGCTAGVQ